MHNVLGVSIPQPFRTYAPFQDYLLPGLVGVFIRFKRMRSAVSMVCDKEAGVTRVMLMKPLPRNALLFAEIFAATILGIRQSYLCLALAVLRMTPLGHPIT